MEKIEKRRPTIIEIQLRHLQPERLTLSLAEGKDNHWLIIPLHNHAHNLVDVCWALDHFPLLLELVLIWDVRDRRLRKKKNE